MNGQNIDIQGIFEKFKFSGLKTSCISKDNEQEYSSDDRESASLYTEKEVTNAVEELANQHNILFSEESGLVENENFSPAYTSKEEKDVIEELNDQLETIFINKDMDNNEVGDLSVAYTQEEEKKALININDMEQQLLVQDTEMYPEPKNDEKVEKDSNYKGIVCQEGIVFEKTEYKLACEIIEREELACIDNPNICFDISKNNGKYWKRVGKQQLKGIIYKYISEKDKHEKSNIEGYCKNIADFIKYEVYKNYFEKDSFAKEDFEKIANHVVFQNGVYDAQTGEFNSFNTKLPYYYAIDANYIEEDEETPYYDKLKEDATNGDEESMDMIDLMIAYLMIPNRSGKCFFVMANAKDSGKSLLGQFIGNMYEGNRTKSIDPEHLSGRFALGDVNEFLLLSCLEMNTDRLKKPVVALIKQMTGEQTMRSEAKYKNEQTVNIRFKLLLATNGGIILPQGMIDSAFYRRLIVIPFIKSTPLDKLVNDLDRKIKAEKDKILSKCIRKLKRYIDKKGGFVFPESALSISMKEKWIGGKSLDNEFIEEAFEFTGNSKDKISVDDIEKVYQFFIETKKLVDRDIVETDRKNLIGKILTRYPTAEKRKARVESILNKMEKKPKPSIIYIKFDKDFLEDIGFWNFYNNF